MKINTLVHFLFNTLKRNSAQTIFLLSIIFLSCDSPKIEYPSELVQLHKNVIEFYSTIPVDETHIYQLLTDMSIEGSWPSIDYTNKVRGGWPVKEHLQHVQDLAIAYQNPVSKYYHTINVFESIHLSLNYWLTNDFLSTNWWDQHIGVPELLAPTLFLMENELASRELKEALVLMKRAKIKMAGQNKVWLAGNVLMTQLLLKNTDSVAIASKAIQGELKISKGLGIKNDYSYHEHGAQLQFGNYGLSYLEDMIKWFTILNNTPFQFESAKIDILRNYVLEGQQWVLYKEKFDVSANGRKFFQNEPVKLYGRVKNCLEIMKVLDATHSAEYEIAINSQLLIGNKHFYRSDFHIHRNKDFYFSVRMSSKRVIGTESVNGENLQGYYQGDGAALLYQSGEEYFNIFPFWDWKKIPGTTIIQDDRDLPVIKAWDFETNSSFVGGVSNDENGIAVLAYKRDSIVANKSWFMFGDKILCLGSNINSETNFPVTTSINQVFLKGSVEIGAKDTIESEIKINKSLEPDWLLHDSIGYLFPNGGNVKIETKFLEGKWSNVASRMRPVILTEDILRLYFDHGSNPNNQCYAYVLVPNTNKENLKYLTKNQPFIFVNSKSQQSAISSDGNIAGVVFYEARKSDLFGGVSVNKPCVVLLQKNENELQISVSDPAQKLNDVQITLVGNFLGEYAIINNKTTILNIPLPKGEASGKSVTFILKEK